MPGPPDLTLITPTADQPTGMSLCERYMAAQTAAERVVQWVVVDDGDEPARLTAGQVHVRRRREPGCTLVESFCRNLLAALPHVRTEFVAVIEHDDLYHARHLEVLLRYLERPNVMVAGDDLQRYYHVGLRLWKTFDNWGAAMCQTGFRRGVIGEFRAAAEDSLRSGWRGVDAQFWSRVPKSQWAVYRAEQVVGIKGLPGRPGIGIGHRPTESGCAWAEDPDGVVLRGWCGEHTETYIQYGTNQEERQAACA